MPNALAAGRPAASASAALAARSGTFAFLGTAASPHGQGDAFLLDAEKLDCYRVAREFVGLAVGLLTRRTPAALRDQLERASLSIVLNIAEGAGRLSRLDKARFYSIARGSATECAAVLDLLLARGLIQHLAYRRGRSLLVRIVQMLTKLAARMEALAKVDRRRVPLEP